MNYTDTYETRYSAPNFLLYAWRLLDSLGDMDQDVKETKGREIHIYHNAHYKRVRGEELYYLMRVAQKWTNPSN